MPAEIELELAGDVWLFPPEVLPQVARVIRARVRRSPTASRHLVGHAYTVASGTQDAPGAVAESAV